MTLKEWQEHKGPILDSVNGFDVIECELCGFKHIVPIPTPDEMAGLYRHEYYSATKPLYVERMQEDAAWWDLTYGERYDTFESLLGPERRKILDIGSGPGLFLLHGKGRGWDVTGIEPSSQAATHSRSMGLTIVEEFLTESLATTLGTFDVIHLSEVLEHIGDPTALLRVAHGLLAPGGIICLVVPNDYSPFQAALRENGFESWWVAPPHHVNYFDNSSGTALLHRCGFEVVLQESTFPIDLFLLMGDNYVGNDTLGRVCHAKRKQFEFAMATAGMSLTKRKFYRALATVGIGRETCLYARR